MRIDLQHACQLLDRVERGGIALALKRRDIGPVDTGKVSQGFLRQAALVAHSLQVPREDLP